MSWVFFVGIKPKVGVSKVLDMALDMFFNPGPRDLKSDNQV